MTKKLFRKLEVRELIDLGADLVPQYTTREKLKSHQLLIDISYPEVEQLGVTRKQIDFMNFDDLLSEVRKFSQDVRSKHFNFRGIRLFDALISRMMCFYIYPRASFNLYDFGS